jgi:hypothetical protein
MASLTIGPGKVRLTWQGPTTLITALPWASSAGVNFYNVSVLNGINRISSNGLGYSTNKPSSGIKPFTQFEQTSTGSLPNVYELDLKLAITLPDSSLISLYGPTVASNTKPTVSITSPAAGTTYTVGATIPLVATATDDTGVSTVEFFNALGTSLGVGVKNGNQYTLSYTAPSSTGNLVITAKATDAAGLSDSASVSLVIQAAATTTPGANAQFDLTQTGAAGIGLNLVEVQKSGYVARSPFSTFTVSTDHTSATVTVNTRGVDNPNVYVAVYANSAFVGFAKTPAQTDDPSRPTTLQTATIALPTGTKTVTFRAGAALYADATIGYVDASITQVVLSGGSTATAVTPAKKPNVFLVLGDSITSSGDPDAASGSIGYIPKSRLRHTTRDVISMSSAGAQLVMWYDSRAKRLALAQQIVALCAGYTGQRTVKIELETNDFPASDVGNTPRAYASVLADITDLVRVLDPTIRFIWQTATYRSLQANPYSGFVLEDYRQAARDAAALRTNYVTLQEGEPIVSQGNFYIEGQVLHPNPAGQDQLVEADYALLASLPSNTGTAVYTPTIADAVIAAYEGESALDSTGNHLDLQTIGNGTAISFSSGAIQCAGGQFLYRKETALDYFFDGFQVDARSQWTGTTGYQTIASAFGAWEVGYRVTSGTTIGRLEFTCKDLAGLSTTITTDSFDISTSGVAATVSWKGATMTAVVNGKTYTKAHPAINPRLATLSIGQGWVGNIDYVRIKALGTGTGTGGGTTPPPAAAGAPTVTKASPATGVPGAQYSIVGTNLLGATVSFGGGIVATNILENSTQAQIVVAVPAGTQTGNVTVSNSAGFVSAGLFTLASSTAPTITSITPYAGIEGDRVTLYGNNLQGCGITIGGVAATNPENTYPTQMGFYVNSGMVSGDMVVVPPAGGGASIIVGYFTIGIPPQAKQVLPDPDFTNPLGVSWNQTGAGWNIANGLAYRDGSTNAFSRLYSQTLASVDLTGKKLRFRINTKSILPSAQLDIGLPKINNGYEKTPTSSPGVIYVTTIGDQPRQEVQLTMNDNNAVEINSTECFILE